MLLFKRRNQATIDRFIVVISYILALSLFRIIPLTICVYDFYYVVGSFINWKSWDIPQCYNLFAIGFGVWYILEGYMFIKELAGIGNEA